MVETTRGKTQSHIWSEKWLVKLIANSSTPIIMR